MSPWRKVSSATCSDVWKLMFVLVAASVQSTCGSRDAGRSALGKALLFGFSSTFRRSKSNTPVRAASNTSMLPCAAGCYGAWCCFAEGDGKQAFGRSDSGDGMGELVLKLTKARGAAAFAQLQQETDVLKALCSVGRGLVEKRIPWTSSVPFAVGGGESARFAILQQRLRGAWFRLSDGMTFYQALLQRPNMTAAAQTLVDMLRWDAFLRTARLVLADLQFIRLDANGEVFVLHTTAVRAADVTAPTFGPMVRATLSGQPLGGPRWPCAWRRNAYKNLRQRALLLSFALAAALVAAGPKGVELLRSTLCRLGACELGCVIDGLPAAVRDFLLVADETFAPLAAVRDVLERLTSIVGISHVEVPHAIDAASARHAAAAAIECSPCCCEFFDWPASSSMHDPSVDMCKVEPSLSSLGLEDALDCFFDRSVAALRCEDILTGRKWAVAGLDPT